MGSFFDVEKFREKLAEIKSNKGFTTFELSVESDISQGVIESIERGEKQPDLKTIIALAKALNVSPDYLVGLTDEPGSFKNEISKMMVTEDGTIKELEIVLNNDTGWHVRGFLAPNENEKEILRKGLKFAITTPRELVQFYWDIVPYILTKLRTLKLPPGNMKIEN